MLSHELRHLPPRLTFDVRRRTRAKTFHAILGLFVLPASQACSFGFRHSVRLGLPWRELRLLLFFLLVVTMRFCLNFHAMLQFAFPSALAVSALRFIIGKPFLTQRYSGSAAPTAELFR